MESQLLRKMFLAFMQVHILHHAKKAPFFGLWMIEELQEHGYKISAGTLYPILHTMESEGVLKMEEKVVEGKVRKYYYLTEKGEHVLDEVKSKTLELFNEIIDK